MENQSRKYLYNHTNPETAYVVSDYPWGFRLRTTIRYWIESKDAKNGGQRFASQTINPKTGQWCKPKYSTYSPIMVIYLDENEHIQYTCLRHNDSEESINGFKENHISNLNDFQKASLKEIIAYTKVMKHVTFTCEVVKHGEGEQRKNDQEEALRNINKAISFEIGKVVL
jgi:hypothetical protein